MGFHGVALLGTVLALSGCANNLARNLDATGSSAVEVPMPEPDASDSNPAGNANGGASNGATPGTDSDGSIRAGDAGGSGGDPSAATGSGDGPDAGQLEPAVPTGVVISEVMARPDKGSDNEWIELYNAGAQSLTLTGCTLATGASQRSDTVIDGALSIAPGEYVLLGRDGVESGSGVRPDYVYSGIYLSATETVTLSCNGSVVTQLKYQGANIATSLQLDARYVLSGKTDVQAAWCDGTDALPSSSNLGTPRAVNHDCAGVAAP